MSFLHSLYVGDFELLDESHLRMHRTSDDPVFSPVVRRSLDSGQVDRLLAECTSSEGLSTIPLDSSIQLADGYLICDRYSLSAEEIGFLRRLVEETGSRMFERTCEVSLDELSSKREARNAGEAIASPASIS